MEAFYRTLQTVNFSSGLGTCLLLLSVAFFLLWITLVEQVLYALAILLKNEYLVNISIHMCLMLRYLVKLNHRVSLCKLIVLLSICVPGASQIRLISPSQHFCWDGQLMDVLTDLCRCTKLQN